MSCDCTFACGHVIFKAPPTDWFAMFRRFAIIVLLGAALLFSQGSSVLLAALCPHLGTSRPVCDMSTAQAAMDHSQSTHHRMDQDTSLGSEVIRHGDEPCPHCVIHSRSDSSPVMVRTADGVKRSADFYVPDSVTVVTPVTPVRITLLTPRDHGPPGRAGRPRHILINTFRI